MAITRINPFEAGPADAEKLHAFLQSVIDVVTGCPGCLSCRLLRGVDDASAFAIIEEWDSVASHQRAAGAIAPERLAEAAAMFARPPSGTYYHA